MAKNKLEMAVMGVGTAFLLSVVTFFDTAQKIPASADSRIHGDGTCDFDSNASMRNLAVFGFLPIIAMRVYGQQKYKKRDPLDFKTFYTQIEVIFHTVYGLWTFESIMTYMKINQNCRNQISVSMITFDLTMILGCFSAVNILFVLMVIMIILPIIAY